MKDPFRLPEDEKERRLHALHSRLANALPDRRRNVRPPPRTRWDGRLHWIVVVIAILATLAIARL